MAYRKLGRTSSQRKAMLRSLTTNLLYNGKIVTTETRAKEVRKIAEGLIALAVREKDNYEEVTVKAKTPRKDKDGKRVKEVVDGKKKTVYDEEEKTIRKDKPSRLHARPQERHEAGRHAGEAFRRDRAQVCKPQRRLHPHRKDRPAQGRRRDGSVDRAGVK